jgi:hypothetical protein
MDDKIIVVRDRAEAKRLLASRKRPEQTASADNTGVSNRKLRLFLREKTAGE